MDELQHLIFKREAEEVNRLIAIHSGSENLKKSLGKKKLMKSNKSKFLAVLNFFPVQKLIFGHF